MTSSKTPHEVNDLPKKIDAALDLCSQCKVFADTKTNGSRNFISFEAMYDEFMSKKFKESSTCTIFDEFLPFHNFWVLKSKILSNEKLTEALIYSKMCDASEYEENHSQYEGELVWVGRNSNDRQEEKLVWTSKNNGDQQADKLVWTGRSGRQLYLVHVSENQIIYSMDECSLNKIRRFAQAIWPTMKGRIRNNLINSFGTTESTSDRSKDAQSVQSSFETAACSNTTFDGNNIRYPLTDKMKQIIIDEVNSLNLDARIKQQFLFDLKMFPDKDLWYWRDRLDCLRFSSKNAVTSPLKQAEACPNAPLQVAEEKSNEKLQQLMENISSLQETVNRNELSLIKLLESKVNVGSSGATCGELLLDPQGKTVIKGSSEQMPSNHRGVSSGGEESNELLKSVADILNIVKVNESSLEAIKDQVKKFDGKVTFLPSSVSECASGVQKNTSLLESLVKKIQDSPGPNGKASTPQKSDSSFRWSTRGSEFKFNK